jgi:hypothetical protein
MACQCAQLGLRGRYGMYPRVAVKGKHKFPSNLHSVRRVGGSLQQSQPRARFPPAPPPAWSVGSPFANRLVVTGKDDSGFDRHCLDARDWNGLLAHRCIEFARCSKPALRVHPQPVAVARIRSSRGYTVGVYCAARASKSQATCGFQPILWVTLPHHNSGSVGSERIWRRLA